jgi:hypothetical protein
MADSEVVLTGSVDPMQQSEDTVPMQQSDDAVTLFGSGERISTSKLLLIQHSDYFKAMFNPSHDGFLESNSKEIELKVCVLGNWSCDYGKKPGLF